MPASGAVLAGKEGESRDQSRQAVQRAWLSVPAVAVQPNLDTPIKAEQRRASDEII